MPLVGSHYTKSYVLITDSIQHKQGVIMNFYYRITLNQKNKVTGFPAHHPTLDKFEGLMSSEKDFKSKHLPMLLEYNMIHMEVFKSKNWELVVEKMPLNLKMVLEVKVYDLNRNEV